MFEKYEDDIVCAILSLKKQKGLEEKLQPQDTLIANQVLFAILKSFVFQDESPDATLHISRSNGHYSYISIPEYLEPLDKQQTIREELKINVLAHKYEYPEYPECSDEADIEPWDKGEDDFKESCFVRLSDDSQEVIRHLSLTSDVYKKIFSSDSSEMLKIIDELQAIEIGRLEDAYGSDVEKLCSMASDGTLGATREIFGHRYLNYNEIRNYVVAKNWFGVVGLAGLSKNSASDGTNSRGWSLSFLSVSPGYRQQGLATKILDECLTWAKDKESYLLRTTPSVVGEKYTFDKFTKYAKTKHPAVPFVPRGYAGLAFRVNQLARLNEIDYKSECRILIELLDMAQTLEKNYPDSNYPYEHVLFSGVLEEKMNKLLPAKKSIDDNMEQASTPSF